MSTGLGLDIGSNSVGSAWVERGTGRVVTGTSIFPAGVDESDDKRGDPKNADRRSKRQARVMLARRAARKRQLRLRLIAAGLLPADAAQFQLLLQATDPFVLRRRGLDEPLTPHQFGRVLLQLAQRRGALGLRVVDEEDADHPDEADDDGKVKAAIGKARQEMRARGARTIGELLAILSAERTKPITTPDRRPEHLRKGPREFREPIRNRAGNYQFCADRQMIRDEFARLWDAQRRHAGALADLLTDSLRRGLDDESGDSVWRHKGLLFGQRRTYWDVGTLGRCALEPTERCVPHADMYASRFLVIETVNNLRVIERNKEARSLTTDEREKILTFLTGPLGLIGKGKFKGRPKQSVSLPDLREIMGEGWRGGGKTAQFRFNIESDEDRAINTDWFSREIIHGAVSSEKWAQLSDRVREGINRALLKFGPDDEKDAKRLREGAQEWAGLSDAQATALVEAWKRRPQPDAKRLNMSRRAARNLLALMDRSEPWPDPKRNGELRWLTPIEARKLIAADGEFLDVTTGKQLDERARLRYATGAKGATARDRHYGRKHLLKRNGELIFGPDGLPLSEPPPAPLISNPVVRKAIHEVRRHLIEYMTTFGRKPDEIYVELSREAKMGKKDADAALFRNRLRNRIRRDIITEFDLHELSSTQQRTAVDRVILCVQQGGVCPLCGNQVVKAHLTPRMAADGEECELAHVIPKASGGHNGLGNVVLAHTKCNRDMARQTPRQFWETTPGIGFEAGMRWVDGIYREVKRPNGSEIKAATGVALWSCYFRGKPGRRGPTFDELKIEQFKKDVKDIKEMTNRQDAATKYAARQVMAYLADALYDGKGLPERGGPRLIYTTDGLWTSRLRREWGLFFDPHHARAKGLTGEAEHERKEKNRGDHRHHAIDAAVIALCTRAVQLAWEEREKRADRDGVNTADEVAMEAYRRNDPLPLPPPFSSREDLQRAVRLAVFGEGTVDRPVCHRPVKRKLSGALHEETLFGPVLDVAGNLTGNFTAKKSVLTLDPMHLRLPQEESEKEAIQRLAAQFERDGIKRRAAMKAAREAVSASGYRRAIVDPPPTKSGIVRDLTLRKRIRQCLQACGIDPDDFTQNQIKRAFEGGRIRHASGVPIRSVVLLRTMSDPVVIDRKQSDFATGTMRRDPDPNSKRAYVGGNNHHIEVRVAQGRNGRANWSGEVVTAFEAAQRKLARLRALRKACIPSRKARRRLSSEERSKWTPIIREIERAHPLVDRTDNDVKRGRFVMSLCEGETLYMRDKRDPEKLGYFVVAKLEKPQSIVLVPHWDARAATARKDAVGKPVADSQREQFPISPGDLPALAPPDRPHAVKIRISRLGVVTELRGD